MDSDVPKNLALEEFYDCAKSIENEGEQRNRWNSKDKDIDRTKIKNDLKFYYNCTSYVPFSSSVPGFDSSNDQSEIVRKYTHGERFNDTVKIKYAEANKLSVKEILKNHLMMNKENKTSAYNIRSENNNNETFNCKNCFKSLKKEENLHRHANNHTTVNDLSCKVCFRLFKHSSDLDVHLLIHGREKPFKCEICGERFAEMNDMVCHWRIHTNKRRTVDLTELTLPSHKSFGCDTCVKQSKPCRSHIFKPFDCIYCGRSFKAFSKLVMHRRSHRGKTRMSKR